MVFSSIPFLYYFLPAVLLVYFAVPRRAKNYVLLAFSLLFYYYGEQTLTLLILAAALVGYLCACVIERWRGNAVIPKAALAFSLVFDLGVLCYFKYADFFLSNFNNLLGTDLPLLKIALPIGISFYLFQSLSYTVDVYRGTVAAQKNPFTYATYLTFFPQLIAGPIVRYASVAEQLNNRTHSLQKFSEGAFRFVIGLSKKVLIANVLGEFVNTYAAIDEKTVALSWLFTLCYSLQLYFDFSGYSDMAIGLGKIFGFQLCENFNYPYIAKTVSEFWQRWHMSLGSWFRDYVYIPLGGNRVKFSRWILNVAIVWFLTGFWHGAGWNFIVWGLYLAVFLVLEKLFLRKWLEKVPLLSHGYLLLVMAISFVIFGSVDYLGSFSAGMAHIGAMFGAGGLPLCSAETLYYWRDYGIVLLLAVIGATPLISRCAKTLCRKNQVFAWGVPLLTAVLLIICTGELADAKFNPFLYFNF